LSVPTVKTDCCPCRSWTARCGTSRPRRTRMRLLRRSDHLPGRPRSLERHPRLSARANATPIRRHVTRVECSRLWASSQRHAHQPARRRRCLLRGNTHRCACTHRASAQLFTRGPSCMRRFVDECATRRTSNMHTVRNYALDTTDLRASIGSVVTIKRSPLRSYRCCEAGVPRLALALPDRKRG